KAAAEQAKTASKSSTEALAIPEQNKFPGKTVNTGKAAAEQAKTASNSNTEALATSSTNKSAAIPEQNKLTGNAATQTKTRPVVKGAKDTIAQNSISAARTAQNKTPEKTGSKGKTGTPLSVPGAKAQNTARQAKTERKPVPQGNAQQEHKEKKAATGKNEIPQNESPEDQATAGGESSGGNALPLAKEKTRRPLNMSAGVKAAYEKGFQSYTANTVVASVFGEVNFSPKVSFIIQPGIKLANTSSEYRTGNGTYIRAGTVQSTMIYEERDSSNTPTGFRNYAYSQTYDSIVASRRAQRKFTEFELPFMVRYKMDNNLSFLAGMNFTFGKTLKMEGMLQTYSGLLLTDTIFRHYDSARIAPPAPAAPAVFSHPGSVPFSAYKDPGATEVINMIRFGYTIGLSYTLRQRLIVDLTLQQNLSRLSDIDDQQIKKLFTQPYVRLSVGYSILGKRK
ncbi:MAG: outer membrane beta-barrel protein, partial [Chitinophagaceae bacterium]|nr:outer membrane beta-barrel protein [Chitinophagaceae bacterium]